MIIQTLMDFARDVLVNWLLGVASLWPASAVTDFLANVTLPTAQVGHALAVIYLPAGWAAIIALLLSYAAFWVATQAIAFVIQRFRVS